MACSRVNFTFTFAYQLSSRLTSKPAMTHSTETVSTDRHLQNQLQSDRPERNPATLLSVLRRPCCCVYELATLRTANLNQFTHGWKQSTGQSFTTLFLIPTGASRTPQQRAETALGTMGSPQKHETWHPPPANTYPHNNGNCAPTKRSSVSALWSGK